MPEPIELNFYNEDDEVIATHVLHRVKTKFLKMAISLKKEIGDPDEMGEQQINALLDFIVGLFGEKFTRDELEDKTDLFECYAVLGQIFGRANALVKKLAGANPTVQSLKKT
jgi:hypothetical protein